MQSQPSLLNVDNTMVMKFIGVAISLLILQLCAAEGNPPSTTNVYKFGQASFSTGPFVPTACYGNDTNLFPANDYFAAGGDGDGTPNIWNNGANCGKWFRIECSGEACTSSTTISIKIIDHCPSGCSGSAFVLSNRAFRAIANTAFEYIIVQYSGPFDSP